jgi:hypothetical protein
MGVETFSYSDSISWSVRGPNETAHTKIRRIEIKFSFSFVARGDPRQTSMCFAPAVLAGLQAVVDRLWGEMQTRGGEPLPRQGASAAAAHVTRTLGRK